SETKILKSLLKVSRPQTVIPTFLGAHSLPPEFTSWQKYLAYWLPYLPRIRSLASRLDIFIDAGFCPLELGKQFLKSAQKLGFMVTIHADQLTRQGATQLGVELGASSVDHVIHVTQKDIQQLSRSETVAVLLPIADLYLKCPYPPARALIDAGACVALSTDFNPGTAPSQSLGLVGLLARLEMKMTLIEVLNGFTVGAAQALRRLDTLGSLEIGKCAHWQIYSHHPFDLFYSADPLRPTQVFIAGQRII
ncbi:MAG: amidohydrolase family protein, partial [Bdellovibrionaceae bacterium]|nr:amidohydrolase family protein [Pseudobdellovibrionaceae bacterium]